MNDYRHELKYHINEGAYRELHHRLSYLLDKDPHYDSRTYKVTSIYFDDGEDHALLQKLDGLEKRKKYRIRYYNDSMDYIRFESKIKHNQYVSKENIRIDEGLMNKMLSGNYLYEPLKADFIQTPMMTYFAVNRFLYKPVIKVEYLREAFIYGDIRITIDKSMRYNAAMNDEVMLRYFSDDTYILEVKFKRFLPSFIKNILQVSDQNLTAISKYTLCRLAKNKMAM